jgi:late competence protein required for DNA uptake (superfamily II DNA/RNA helicase)
MAKIHNSKEWKQNRDSIITPKSRCAWCNSKIKLSIHHPEDLHETPEDIKHKIYEKYLNDFLIEYVKKNNIPLINNKLILSKEQQEKAKNAYSLYTIQNNINQKIYEEITLTTQKYISMTDTIILCNRCHYAHHKGLELCPICYQNYKYPQYPYCSKCKVLK